MELAHDKLYDVAINGTVEELEEYLKEHPHVHLITLDGLFYQQLSYQKYKLLISPHMPPQEASFHLRKALTARNEEAVKALLDSNVIFNPNINFYFTQTLKSEQLWFLLLQSNKFNANNDTFKQVATFHHPDHLKLYLQWSGCVLPEADKIREVIQHMAPYESTIEVLLEDQRIPFTGLSKKTLLELSRHKRLHPLLIKRIPEMEQILKRKEEQEEKRKLYGPKSIFDE